jgi:hypothetical protein
MRMLLTIFLTAFSLTTFGQTIKEMTPTLGYLVDKSPEGEIEFIKAREKCETVWAKINNQKDYETLSVEDKKIYDNCDETYENYYDVLGQGCSWYCGGGQDTASASSELKPFKGFKYSASNSHDLSYKTAWIEGVPGYGIGEYLVYHFPPQNPRITKIIIVNGYVKSEKAWKENSRVKKLKMYIDDKPFAILNLADTRQEQTFSFEPIGYGDRDDWKKLEAKPWWTMKFEIMDVYKGDKYDETAITEIYYDGIDVHCFAAGTNILMADKTEKNIELIKTGDNILTFNNQTNQLSKTIVTQLVVTRHSNLIKLTFDDREIIVTDDHPFFTDNKHWSSVNPDKSNNSYLQDKFVTQLSLNDNVFVPSDNKFIRLKSIEHIAGEQLTYTIEITTGDSFIANGLLVKTETVKWTN